MMRVKGREQEVRELNIFFGFFCALIKVFESSSPLVWQ